MPACVPSTRPSMNRAERFHRPAARVAAPTHHHVPAASANAGRGHVKLMPGEWHFGPQALTLSTLLGSCVAVTLWHPGRRIGGMCHYLLPSRIRPAGAALEGRFGDEVMSLMVSS